LKNFTPDPLAGFEEETTKGREGKGKMRAREKGERGGMQEERKGSKEGDW